MALVKPTIAVFGATGHLGQHIAAALLDPGTRSKFRNVVLLSRRATKLQRWQKYDVVIRQCSERNLVVSLENVDIVVDAVGPSGAEFSRRLIAAMAQAKVMIYFPPEFDVDHNLHDFRFAEWDWKKSNVVLARAQLPGTKVCQVFASLLLEQAFGPWLGFCSKRQTYACVGSKDVAISFTSVRDLARTIVQLCLIELSRIPDQVHIGGHTATFSDVATIMSRENGNKIRVVELPLAAFKASVLTAAGSKRTDYLRCVMAEGKANHGRYGVWNVNELVNPGGSRWEWTTVDALAKQTGGRPWSDADWPDVR